VYKRQGHRHGRWIGLERWPPAKELAFVAQVEGPARNQLESGLDQAGKTTGRDEVLSSVWDLRYA